MNRIPKVSGASAITVMSHYFEQLPKKKKELLISKLVENLSEDVLGDLLQYIEDPKNAVIGKQFSLSDKIEVMVSNTSYGARNSLKKLGCSDDQYIQAEIIDFKFNSCIDFIVKPIGFNIEDLITISEYYVRKLEIF